MSIIKRSFGSKFDAAIESEQNQAARVAALSQILDVLPDAAAIIDASDQVLEASANCVAMGLVSNDRIAPVEIRALNREVNRLRKTHELKTPVGALSLLAEAVQAADTDIEQVRHFTSRMQIEVKRLTAMISDLVALSQVQGDAALRTSAPVQVQSIIAEAVDATKISAEQQHIEVSISDDVEPGRIFGDEQQLVTALSNLISNAIKYSPSHTKVGVGSRRVGNMIEISVTDQGPGIPESDVERIFERFYRVDPARSRDTGGTGLGLAIVKHVCANHGGECTVWSQVGQGSTFTLRIPAYLNGSATPAEVSGK